MRLRFGMAVAVLLCTGVAGAQPASWEAGAIPLHPRLPQVRVILGEPGFVSTRNTPIEIHATAGVPFDGYIGVHFEVEGRRTLDVPVVARAELAPGRPWVFRTWIQLHEPGWSQQIPLNRELAVEWRDRSMQLIGSTVAGTPPWSHPRPLRVVASAGEQAGNCCLGAEPHVRPASQLSDVAQWYSGFRELVVETRLWLDLPASVKSAAFSSGVPLIFVGPPAAGQPLSDVDRTLIPVEFTSTAGEYEVPWPWLSNGTRMTAPSRWRAKPGTEVVGVGSMPYLVSSGRAVFVADATALSSQLPVMHIDARGRHWGRAPVYKGGFASIVRGQLPLVAVTGVLLLCGILAWALRRSPRIGALAASLLVTAGLLACRDQLRPRVGVSILEESTPIAPGVFRRVINVREHGPTPIPARDASVAEPHLWVSRRGRVQQAAELRASDTPPGYGAMFLHPDLGPWDSTSRWMTRDEIGEPLQVTIRGKDGDKLVFQYAAPFAPDYAQAMWIWNGIAHWGDVRLDRRTRGVVTITPWEFLRDVQNVDTSVTMSGDVRIRFIRLERNATLVAGWQSSGSEAANAGGNRLSGLLYRHADGTLRGRFVAPPSAAARKVSIHTTDTLRRVMVAGPAETLQLEPAGEGRNFFSLDGETLARVAEQGIVELIVEPVDPTADEYQASMSWKESR